MMWPNADALILILRPSTTVKSVKIHFVEIFEDRTVHERHFGIHKKESKRLNKNLFCILNPDYHSVCRFRLAQLYRNVALTVHKI